MTPADQYDLPLLVIEDAMTATERALLRDFVAPLLGRDPPGVTERTVLESPYAGGTRTSVLAESRGTVRPVQASIQATVHRLERFRRDPRAAEDVGPEHTIMLALRDLLLDLADAPGVARPTHPASYRRVTLAALRMREAVGEANAVHDGIDLRFATPLGMGGAVVHDAPFGSRDRSTIGHLVDRSPDLALPGPVTTHVQDNVYASTGIRRIDVVVGGPVRSQSFIAIDPIERMRLEALHPWDPSSMTHHPLEPDGDR